MNKKSLLPLMLLRMMMGNPFSQRLYSGIRSPRKLKINRSRNKPHQGAQECARRLKKYPSLDLARQGH